jgi:uncharacterized hydrophobic protein (TIGR00271 family)
MHMGSAYLSYYRKKLTEYLAVKTEMVNHRAVIKEVASNVDRSWVYYITLVLASLIALLGLLTNSVAVVIGAMLISPLMGPMISSSLAFTIGDLPLARRAFQTIATSVALTIAICAVFSFISPLKEPTAEILTRVHPNIFDLFVAVISGVVGAIALCTKRSYLITSVGVAVATAVIPPLSVTGYGLGTWQPMLALGGFLLFFTNFVAIVLSSDLVFFILGFRTSHVETIKYSRRTRLLIIAGLLTLISIPLAYTLVNDLAKVKEKKQIERILKRHLNKDQVSRMTRYEYQVQDGELLVKVSVNTVKFIGKPSEGSLEKELSGALERPVDVQLEQVIVASAKVQKQPDPVGLLSRGASATRGPQAEGPAQVRDKVESMVLKAQGDLTQYLAPFPVSRTRIAFASGVDSVEVTATLKRDYPVGEDERLLLARLLGRTLELPVSLTVTTVPLLPPLLFEASGALTPASAASLAPIKHLSEGGRALRYVIESPSGKPGRNLRTLKSHLTQELGIPGDAISARTGVRGADSRAVVLRILRR